MEYDAEQRHEYYDGEIVAMAGGTPQHSLIFSTIIREVGMRSKGGGADSHHGLLVGSGSASQMRWPIGTQWEDDVWWYDEAPSVVLQKFRVSQESSP